MFDLLKYFLKNNLGIKIFQVSRLSHLNQLQALIIKPLVIKDNKK